VTIKVYGGEIGEALQDDNKGWTTSVKKAPVLIKFSVVPLYELVGPGSRGYTHLKLAFERKIAQHKKDLAAFSARLERSLTDNVPTGPSISWHMISRGDAIPPTAVWAGEHRNDGAVYVGSVGGHVGKINTDSAGKMYNFWAHGLGSSSSNVMIMCYTGVDEKHQAESNWHTIRKYDEIPRNAVYGGKTSNDGYNFVGRFNGEVGKINTNNSKGNSMCNFWGHSEGRQQGGGPRPVEIFLADEPWSATMNVQR